MREIMLQLCDPVIKMAGDLYFDHPHLKFPIAHHPARLFERLTYIILINPTHECIFLAYAMDCCNLRRFSSPAICPQYQTDSASLQRNRGLPGQPMKCISLCQPSMLHLPGEEHSCGHEDVDLCLAASHSAETDG